MNGKGRLTTHVLDLVKGVPAAGVRVELKRLVDNELSPVTEAVTDADGRCERPLLDGDAMMKGTWELSFHVADYFHSQEQSQGQPKEELPFLDVVILRFSIAHEDQTYHVPLLVTPWSYSTYRGS